MGYGEQVQRLRTANGAIPKIEFRHYLPRLSRPHGGAVPAFKHAGAALSKVYSRLVQGIVFFQDDPLLFHDQCERNSLIKLDDASALN